MTCADTVYNTILNKLIDDDAPQLWTLADLEPNKKAEVLAEELAVYLTSVTNEAK